MKQKLYFQILIFLSFNFFNNSAFSQSNNKLELGLGVTSQLIQKFNFDSYGPNISAKYLMNKNAIRAGVSLRRNINIFGILNINNIGYEHRFFNSDLKLITGFDVCYLYKSYDDKADFDGAPVQKFQHIGLGPVVGAAFQLNKRFSIQTEMGAFWGYGYGEIDNREDVLSTGWGYTTIHRLLSFHVYYCFGK